MTMIVTDGARGIGSNLIFRDAGPYRGSDRLFGQAHLHGESVHAGARNGDGQLPLCQGEYLRPGGSIQAF